MKTSIFSAFLIFSVIFTYCTVVPLTQYCIHSDPPKAESLPLLTYYHTSENHTSNYLAVESAQYWEYTNFLHGQEIENPVELPLDIYLLCNHTKPVKFVSNTNPAEEPKITLTSYTYRQVRNYSDPSTERFIAVVRLQVELGHNSPIIYICEDIQEPCNSRIVITEYETDAERFMIRNYNYSDHEVTEVLTDFSRERDNIEILNQANNDTCPLKLTLYYFYEPSKQGFLAYTWHDDDSTRASLVFPSDALQRENDYRLARQLGENCVNGSNLPYPDDGPAPEEICPKCGIYDFQSYPGYPYVVLYNRAASGIQRVLHIHFDLNMQTMRFLSESAHDDDLTAITFGEDRPDPRFCGYVFISESNVPENGTKDVVNDTESLENSTLDSEADTQDLGNVDNTTLEKSQSIIYNSNSNFSSNSIQEKETEFYRGETIKITCVGSAAKFAVGGFLLWGVPGDVTDAHDVAIPLNDDDSCVNQFIGGAIKRPFKLNVSKELLDARNASRLNITCLFPVWNTTEWVPKSAIVKLKESAYPSASLIREADSWSTAVTQVSNMSSIRINLGEDLRISCIATGIPLPEISFKSNKKTLNFTILEETKLNSTAVKQTILLNNVDHTFEDVYSFSLKNAVGESEISFEVVIYEGLSPFVKYLILAFCLAVALFIIIGATLLLKYRKEQVDFQRKTAEAIRKFHEGFKDTKGIGFAFNAEHKAYELPLTHWDFGGTILGKGAFGTVHKGCIRQGQRVTVVAVKTVNAPKDVLEFESSLKELLIMSYIGKHPHIISLIATCTDNMAKRSLILATEYCANGDLLSYLTKNKKYFCKDGKCSVLSSKNDNESAGYMNIVEEDDKSYSLMDLHVWSLHIADGMAFLESKKVLHGDLAARNVLLTQDKVAKISDFGLSRQLTDDGNYTKQTYCPLPWKWMALESLQYRVFSPRSDVWAYGITLYEIYSLGDEPWSYLDWTTEFVDELEHGRRLVKPQFATDEIYEKVMLESWRNNPEDRPSFKDIKTFYVSFVPQAEHVDEKIYTVNPKKEEEASRNNP